MRGAKPVAQHPVFTHPVEHAVRADDGRVDGARQHQEAHDHDKGLKPQFQHLRTGQVHGNTADHVVEILRPDRVWNNGVGEE